MLPDNACLIDVKTLTWNIPHQEPIPLDNGTERDGAPVQSEPVRNHCAVCLPRDRTRFPFDRKTGRWPGRFQSDSSRPWSNCRSAPAATCLLRETAGFALLRTTDKPVQHPVARPSRQCLRRMPRTFKLPVLVAGTTVRFNSRKATFTPSGNKSSPRRAGFVFHEADCRVATGLIKLTGVALR